MNRNAKIIGMFFCIMIVLIILGLCAEPIFNFIFGIDGKCDFCGDKVGIQKGTTEYCHECFMKSGETWY